MFQNILIFGHANIGDVVYDLAVVAPLHNAFPRAKITFLTASRCRDVVAGYKGIDRIIAFDRHGKDKGFLNHARMTAALRREKFDLAVVLTRSLNHLFLQIPSVWSLREATGLQDRHPVDHYIQALRNRGLLIEAASFGFGLEEKDIAFREEYFKQKGISREETLIGILPLAAWSLKSWPVEKWNTLAEILQRRWGVRVISLGRLPSDKLGRRIGAAIADNIICADNTTLAQAKALLHSCRLFVGPDSSLLHWASCMGIETVGLYGPTPAERFYPYFHRHNVIVPREKPACLPCYPGKRLACCTNNTPPDFGPCMEGIRVEDVLAVITRRLRLA